MLAYQGEPLADSDENEEGEHDAQIDDPDGLAPAILEARYEKRVQVNEWCSCNRCDVPLLVGALEYRCCWEVNCAQGKLTFDGSIERIKCVTEHEDFLALMHPAVLKQVAPLLKNRDGRTYRQRAGQTLNEHMRAVGYRWVVRYIFGFLGWENTKPLPACIYHYIRSKFPDNELHGYATAQQRA
eukprot:Seg2427.12 transcript_id=Seg2427.12/GoldUCD/mRNA.D3Y31 product="hypothetical protein" protein_id=Seg2427.12/GoldUCD/D3Y31